MTTIAPTGAAGNLGRLVAEQHSTVRIRRTSS